MRIKTALAGMAAMFTATAAFAVDYSAAMRGYMEQNLASWVAAPEIVQAIAAQNTQTAGYDASQIDALDQQWRAQVGTGSTPLIDAVMNNPASEFLRQQVALSGGAITEIFIMDSMGLNVAASGVTSDYWQGDEAKFQQTYAIGPDAVHFSDVEFDESSQSFQAQISMPVVDESGKVIGAITVGVLADALL
ncbi:cache domain-containing protein [Cognatishimia sp. F0-27]|uniref:cache domain-containing protein n=1 Tax=Cognatishimia sp. F0-27 TaxID=2816855 RepID=UPI001D0CD4BA|nr:cache domain-containing protein [Cognatishimia sp. F0-27]MCC1491832.1 cache domain-containing protein [Cognatishimia sp. F0-27]